MGQNITHTFRRWCVIGATVAFFTAVNLTFSAQQEVVPPAAPKGVRIEGRPGGPGHPGRPGGPGGGSSSCAALKDGNSCGFAGCGRMKIVYNQRRDVRVKATVRRTWVLNGQNQSSQSVHALEPGGQMDVGCTCSEGDDVIQFRYAVAACSVVSAGATRK
jgi:hypothetical protein